MAPSNKILAIMKIKNRVLPMWLRVVAGRKINNEVALISQKARGKLLMLDEMRVRSRSNRNQQIFGLHVLARGN